jgi:integrase
MVRKKRRSVEFDGEPWVGWSRLLGYYNHAPTDRHRDVFALAFETGGRASEIVELKPSNFSITEEAIRVDAMVVRKYKSRRMQRSFLINRKDDRLAEALVKLVEGCDTEFLLPRYAPLAKKEIKIANSHIGATRLYQLVAEISPEIWPHWLRSQRASYFVFEKNANPYQLADWFKWKSMDTPLRYVKQSLQEQKNWLGIPDIEKVEQPKLELV